MPYCPLNSVAHTAPIQWERWNLTGKKWTQSLESSRFYPQSCHLFFIQVIISLLFDSLPSHSFPSVCFLQKAFRLFYVLQNVCPLPPALLTAPPSHFILPYECTPPTSLSLSFWLTPSPSLLSSPLLPLFTTSFPFRPHLPSTLFSFLLTVRIESRRRTISKQRNEVFN